MRIGIGLGISQIASRGGGSPAVSAVSFDLSTSGGNTFTDTAGTTPAVATDPVARADDDSGSNSFLQATSGSRPTQTASGLQFDGVDDNMLCTSASPLAIIQSGRWRVDWIGTFQAIIQNLVIFSIGDADAATDTALFIMRNSGLVRFAFNGQVAITTTTAVPVETEVHIRVEVVDGVQTIYNITASETAQATSATTGSSTNLDTMCMGARFENGTVDLNTSVTTHSLTVTQL